jgi:hypothetical protein
MNHQPLRLVVVALLAVAVPATILHFMSPTDRRADGLTISPFGWPRILVAHLTLELPLGFLLADRTKGRTERWLEGWDIAWILLGLLMAILAGAMCVVIGEWVLHEEPAGWVLVGLRVAIATVVVYPWCLLAGGASDLSHEWVAGKLLLALGIAIVPCALYAEAVAQARCEDARDLLQRERLLRANRLLLGLADLGSQQPIDGKAAKQWRRYLRERLPYLERVATKPLPATATEHQRLARVTLLVQLDRLETAAQVLQGMDLREDTTALLLASICRDQQKFNESDRLFAMVLERCSADAQRKDAGQNCMIALQGLSFNARQTARATEVEPILRRGLEILPQQAGYFHLQLGKHYAEAGLPFRARQHFEQARSLEPTKYGHEAEVMLRRIRSSTPACLP